MVRRPVVHRIVVFSMALAGWGPPAPGGAQQGADATAGVRPARVRVGDTFVVTIRAVGPARPDAVELVPDGRSHVLEVAERESWSVGAGGARVVVETDFTVRALAAGRASPQRAWVVRGGDTIWLEVPAVEAVAVARVVEAERPPARRAEEGRVRDEGLPPDALGRDGRPYVGGYAPYPPYVMPGQSGTYPPYGQPGTPYAPVPWPAGPGGGYAWGQGQSGWGMAAPGRPWGPAAAADPWWPELIPRLERYQATAADPRGLVTLEAGATPLRAYVGQQVTLVATASFAPEAAARLGPAPELFLPPAREAWSVDVPYAPPTPAAVGGRLSEAHTVMRAYFPTGPGRLELGAVRIRYSVGSGGAAHAPQDELATQPFGVEVLPVPMANAAPGWGGAVGRFRAAAWVQPRAVGWGEAALLTLEVSGAGNVQALQRPDPGPVWGAEVRPAGERGAVEVRDGVVGGVKTFTWLVVPLEPGVVRIGPILFPYFDPWIGSHGAVASEEVVLDARGLDAVAGGYAERGDGVETEEPAGGDGAWSDDGAWSQDGGWPDDAEGVDAARPAPAAPQAARRPDWLPPAAAGATEPRVRDALGALSAHRSDPARWLALAEAFGAERPGEGWREWALLSGAGRAPRDPALRRALWGHGGWAGPAWGLQRIPMAPLTSRRAAAGAGAATLLLLGVAARLPASERRRRVALLLAALAAAAGVATVEPWVHHHRAPGPGVTVDGPVEVRSSPSWSAPVASAVAPGTPLSIHEGFGGWVRVTGRGGISGWVEASQALPLASPLDR